MFVLSSAGDGDGAAAAAAADVSLGTATFVVTTSCGACEVKVAATADDELMSWSEWPLWLLPRLLSGTREPPTMVSRTFGDGGSGSLKTSSGDGGLEAFDGSAAYCVIAADGLAPLAGGLCNGASFLQASRNSPLHRALPFRSSP